MVDQCFRQANLEEGLSREPVFTKASERRLSLASQAEQRKSKRKQPKAAQSTTRDPLTAQDINEGALSVLIRLISHSDQHPPQLNG